MTASRRFSLWMGFSFLAAILLVGCGGQVQVDSLDQPSADPTIYDAKGGRRKPTPTPIPGSPTATPTPGSPSSAPANMAWSSYLGGSGAEYMGASTADSTGIYVVGATNSPDFVLLLNGTARAPSNNDAFIMKISTDGNTVLWQKYLGGPGSDTAVSVRLDPNDPTALYVMGGTGSLSVDPYAATNGLRAYRSGFLAKMNRADGTLLSDAYFGDTNVNLYPVAMEIAGATGNLFITGFKETGPVFLKVLNNQRPPVQIFSRDYDGNGQGDDVRAIALDSRGRPILAGVTFSSDFASKFCGSSPVPGYQPVMSTSKDAFVVKLNLMCTTSSCVSNGCDFFTYLGGPAAPAHWGYDVAKSVAVDAGDNVYLAGDTDSPVNFPTTAGAYDRGPDSVNADGFVTKLAADGRSLLWSTLLGGSGWEYLNELTLLPNGNVAVVGCTSSSDFPITSGAQPYHSFGDAVVSILSADGSNLVSSTYLGGNGLILLGSEPMILETANWVTVIPGQNRIAVTGITLTPDFPIKGGFDSSFGNTFGGTSGDGFLAVFNY